MTIWFRGKQAQREFGQKGLVKCSHDKNRSKRKKQDLLEGLPLYCTSGAVYRNLFCDLNFLYDLLKLF